MGEAANRRATDMGKEEEEKLGLEGLSRKGVAGGVRSELEDRGGWTNRHLEGGGSMANPNITAIDRHLLSSAANSWFFERVKRRNGKL
ncbi:hypothetical protein BHE74_00038739 [Ensete ventricosum]|uniref:Uncharacterized protein n=1 Tax=Ensete ventricosum TaxID=4639 RepID=A0A426ZHZ5_ENSVE|nr:hypothetical protein B296_00029396 [Ensete ventricosum]RWV82695.1 hypothetical protein GW17_00055783 [Ensete ventricosum]RWW54668.1 hypothetical protein BHE74_00038739 [Ensete ventricosum]